jgi:hypothetical protein
VEAVAVLVVQPLTLQITIAEQAEAVAAEQRVLVMPRLKGKELLEPQTQAEAVAEVAVSMAAFNLDKQAVVQV